MMADERDNAHCLRSAVCNGKHIHAKGIFQSCLFVEQIAEIFGIGSLFQINDDTNAFFGGLVGNINDICRLFRLDQTIYVI